MQRRPQKKEAARTIKQTNHQSEVTRRRRRTEKERKGLNPSHHQTHTRAGFPFLTDGNQEDKKKGREGHRENGGIKKTQSEAVRLVPEEEKQQIKRYRKGDNKGTFEGYRRGKNNLLP